MNFELGFHYLAMISLTRWIEVNAVTVAQYLSAFTKIKHHSLTGRGGEFAGFFWWIRKPAPISSLQDDEPIQNFQNSTTAES